MKTHPVHSKYPHTQYRGQDSCFNVTIALCTHPNSKLNTHLNFGYNSSEIFYSIVLMTLEINSHFNRRKPFEFSCSGSDTVAYHKIHALYCNVSESFRSVTAFSCEICLSNIFYRKNMNFFGRTIYA